MKADKETETFPKFAKRSGETLSQLSDADLALRWKQGNQTAATLLAKRHRLRLELQIEQRMNRQYRGVADPQDVVQSAFHSFFHAISNRGLKLADGRSASRVLSTIARRKLLRLIERESTQRRGGHLQRVDRDGMSVESIAQSRPDDQEQTSDELLRNLDPPLRAIAEQLRCGYRKNEIASQLGISVRTVRRRLRELGQLLRTDPQGSREANPPSFAPDETITLPRIHYRQFVLGRWIGSGAFGKVYRASMQSDGRMVAVKFLRKRFWQHDAARRSFLREIEAASMIDHPGVIRYLGWGQSPHGGPFVVSEWIDGVTLETCVSMPAERKVSWLRALCECLAAIHDAGVVHGDITPGNVLITRSDRIVLTDFGFARRGTKSLDSEDPVPRPEETSLMGGTPGFAAPEQIDAAFGPINARTDIYAIGGLAYWCLRQHPPHNGNTLEAVLSRTVAEDAPKIDSGENESPPERLLRRVAQRALRQSAADRPRDTTSLIKLLG